MKYIKCESNNPGIRRSIGGLSFQCASLPGMMSYLLSKNTIWGVVDILKYIYIYYRYIDIIYIKSHILSYMGQCLHLVIKCILFGNLFHICWSHGPFSFISDYPLFKLVIFNNYVE